MREIIFTGKRKDNGEWVYGWLGHLHSYNPQTKDISSIYFTEISEDFNSKQNVIVDYKTIGQYTGLTDKNGKMIFEGHILKWTNTDNEVIFTPVGFKNGCFVINPTREDTEILYDFLCLDMEIVGNIYDNPELLK